MVKQDYTKSGQVILRRGRRIENRVNLRSAPNLRPFEVKTKYKSEYNNWYNAVFPMNIKKYSLGSKERDNVNEIVVFLGILKVQEGFFPEQKLATCTLLCFFHYYWHGEGKVKAGIYPERGLATSTLLDLTPSFSLLLRVCAWMAT